jgi:hypothetical protein
MGCQRVRANRRMPMTASTAPVRTHQRSRRTDLAARDLPGEADMFDLRRSRRRDRSLMAAFHPPGGRSRLLLRVYPKSARTLLC